MLALKLIYTETYTLENFGITDISTYPVGPINNPKINICIPGFGEKIVNFNPNSLNIFNSSKLGITEIGHEQELPDGLYNLKYCIDSTILPSIVKTCKTISFFRISKLQEKFDNAFLKLEIAECDGALKKQELINLNLINAFIQTAVASANNCSEKQAIVLYSKANKMLDKFMISECGCN